MSIPIISAYLCLGFVGCGRPTGERRHPLAAGKRAMLDCSRFAVERISAGAAVESRFRRGCGRAGVTVSRPSGGGEVEAHESHELAEHLQHGGGHGHAGHDWFRRMTGIYLGVVAMLLAIASLGGSEATKEMLNSNIHASDTYAFYQSKYIRQIHYQTAAEELELLAAGVDRGCRPSSRARSSAGRSAIATPRPATKASRPPARARRS